MKVKLLETVHVDYLPAGTIGSLSYDKDGFRLFIPDNPVEDYGFDLNGAYIGCPKMEEVK